MAHSHSPGIFRRFALGVLTALAARPPQDAEKANGEVRRILVVELWNIGDVVLLLPFLSQLREIFPSARVTLLAKPHAREVLGETGLVDEFLDDAAPSDNWLSLNPLLGGWRDLWKLRARLRSRRFDIAFQCRLHVREHVILAMSGARRRVGYAFGEGDTMLTDAVPVGDPHRHKVADWMGLLGVFGGPVATGYRELAVPETSRAAAGKFLAGSAILPGDLVVGIHPGASVAEKRWPLERFAEVAASIAERPGVRVVAFAEPGGYGESLGDIEGVALARTSLRDLIAFIDRCDVLVCNDSGPMHIAGGLDVTAVAIFSSGVARWFAPLGDSHELITADEGGVSSIPVQRIVDVVDRVLSVRRARYISTPSIQPLSPS